MKSPKKFPFNGPNRQDQETMAWYWVKPEEAKRLAIYWKNQR